MTTTIRGIGLRKDVSSQKMMNKNLLVRVVKTKTNEVTIDWNQNIQGRGVYVAKNFQAVKKAQQTNAFSRALRMKVNPEIYELLIEGLNAHHG